MATDAAVGRKHDRDRLYPTGFAIRCTHVEKVEIYARAELANRSASRFLVELALRADGQAAAHHLSPQDLTLVEGLMVQLQRLGTILIELARREHASAYDHTDPPADADLRNAVRKVKEGLAELRSRLT